MMKYWKKLHRDCAGHYYAESDYTTDVLRIYKIERGLWGYCFGRGMTKGTFSTLKKAKEHFCL